MSMILGDEVLAECAAHGDHAAFTALVERYALRLLRLLILTCGVPTARAEDVAKEVWLKAWRGLPQKQPGPFRGWLFRIARNAAEDDRQRADHRRLRQDAAGDVLPAAADPAASPEQELTAAETARRLARRLARCLERLQPDFRAAIVGHAAGHDCSELAERFGVPPATVKTRLHRGRALLRACLE